MFSIRGFQFRTKPSRINAKVDQYTHPWIIRDVANVDCYRVHEYSSSLGATVGGLSVLDVSPNEFTYAVMQKGSRHRESRLHERRYS